MYFGLRLNSSTWRQHLRGLVPQPPPPSPRLPACRPPKPQAALCWAAGSDPTGGMEYLTEEAFEENDPSKQKDLAKALLQERANVKDFICQVGGGLVIWPVSPCPLCHTPLLVLGVALFFEFVWPMMTCCVLHVCAVSDKGGMCTSTYTSKYTISTDYCTFFFCI